MLSRLVATPTLLALAALPPRRPAVAPPSLIASRTRAPFPCLSEASSSSSWRVEEDWALMDSVKAFTVGEGTNSATFWDALAVNSVVLADRTPSECAARMKVLSPSPFAGGPQPQRLDMWTRLADGRYQGADGGRTVYITVSEEGQLAEGSRPSYIRSVDGRVYELMATAADGAGAEALEPKEKMGALAPAAASPKGALAGFGFSDAKITVPGQVVTAVALAVVSGTVAFATGFGFTFGQGLGLAQGLGLGTASALSTPTSPATSTISAPEYARLMAKYAQDDEASSTSQMPAAEYARLNARYLQDDPGLSTRVYSERGSLGLVSYHFSDVDDSYVSYQPYDGSPMMRKFFSSSSFDAVSNTFYGTINFDTGTQLNYEVAFSDDMNAIVGGRINPSTGKSMPISPRIAMDAAIFPTA